MGSGVSTLARLRKSLVIKAYNLRSEGQTLDQQFREYAFRKPGESSTGSTGSTTYYITFSDVKKCLQLNNSSNSWVDDLFKMFDESLSEMINFDDFISFLESGKLPTDRNSNKLPSPLRKAKSEIPPIPPTPTPTQSSTYRSDENSKFWSQEFIDDDQNFIVTMPAEDDPPICNEFALTTTGTRSPSLPSNSDLAKKPMWRKREFVKQERIVQYTTIDESGETQELIEKEIQQTEILHMECRETGEFAHRETTHYEQTETFNDEVVNEQKGTEEYVHLKSLEDEYEYMESNLPKKGQPKTDEDADGAADATGAGAATDDILGVEKGEAKEGSEDLGVLNNDIDANGAGNDEVQHNLEAGELLDLTVSLVSLSVPIV